jgi:hypothetical protein
MHQAEFDNDSTKAGENKLGKEMAIRSPFANVV